MRIWYYEALSTTWKCYDIWRYRTWSDLLWDTPVSLIVKWLFVQWQKGAGCSFICCDRYSVNRCSTNSFSANFARCSLISICSTIQDTRIVMNLKIPQSTSPITYNHNTPFCNINVHISVTKWCYKMVHCGIFVWCTVGFLRWVYSIVTWHIPWYLLTIGIPRYGLFVCMIYVLPLQMPHCMHSCVLTHWGRDKMDAISHTTFWSAFSWMKIFEFRLKFHWSLFLRVQLTIFQHWFR